MTQNIAVPIARDASRPEPLQSTLSRTRKFFVWFDLGGAGHTARMAIPARHGVNVVLLVFEKKLVSIFSTSRPQ